MMLFCWIACCYSYYIFIFYIKYLPADIYLVSIVSGISAFGYLLSAPISKRFNIKYTQLFSFIIVGFLLLILILFGGTLNTFIYAGLILLLKLFVCLGFGTLFVIHFELFDSSFISTSYGICNMISRLVTVTAPMVAEMKNKTNPILILMVFNTAAAVATSFLRSK